MSFEVSLSERAENACGQEGWGDVCRRLLHVGAEYVHNSGRRTHMVEALVSSWQGNSQQKVVCLCITC